MDPLLVAAIDFGTTYSGWAYSFRHDYEKEPTKISAKNWTRGKLVSAKGPTCLLIKPDGKTFDSFGFEAESKYAELALEGHHKQWYFFKRFKMMLHGRIGVEKDIMIEDATGKKVKAQTIFTLAIKFLKDDLLETSEKRLCDGGLTENDIRWVLTVPAIWNDVAKSFMRQAAVQAGILSDKLMIALEPEAASIFCRHLPVTKVLGLEKLSLAQFSAGTKYLVLDAGGGTVDITVHEILTNDSLRELHRASGGAWGGIKVDDAFENFLTEIFGKKTITSFRDQYMEDFVDVFRDFELKKRETLLTTDTKITMRFPLAFFDVVRDTTGSSVKDIISKSNYKASVTLVGDKIRIDTSLMRSLFESTISSICQHLLSVFKERSVYGCSVFLLVGGFSESPLLQQRIQDTFPSMKLIIPDEAGLAVLKGAVIFGHSPQAIAERKCRFSYGIASDHITSGACSHPPCKPVLCKDAKLRCTKLFSKHVTIDQAVKIGEETKKHTYYSVYEDQTSQTFRIFASPKANPDFTTEEDCTHIGSVTVDFSDAFQAIKKGFDVSFKYGETEIEVKIVNNATGTMTIKCLDLT